MSEPFVDPSTRQPKAPVELETFLGGRGLQAVGLISIFLSAAFFFKLAVDHGWLSEEVRVIIGLVTGVMLLAAGVVIHRRPTGNRAIVEGLLALGGALCYLSLWAAGPLFDIIPSGAAFASMGAVTAVLTVLAAYHRSFLTALYGVIGGLVTPAFLPHAGQQWILAAYLLVLCAAMLKLAGDARFRFIPIVAFAGSLYYVNQFGEHGEWTYLHSLVAASLFFLEFAVARFLVIRRTGTVDVHEITLSTFNVTAYTLMLVIDLQNHHYILAGMLAALSAVLGWAAFNARAGEAAHAMYLWSATLALGFSFPAFFLERHWMTFGACALEGALMYALGAYRGWNGFKRAGIVTILFAAPVGIISIFVQLPSTDMFFDRIDLYGMIAGALYVVAKVAHQKADTVPEAWDADLGSIAVSLANLVVVTGIGNITYTLPADFGVTLSQQQLITSVAWTLLAAIIFAVGLYRNNSVLRWQSLALFAVTIVKVVTIDLASIELIDRVAVCFGLGVATLIVSAFYLRLHQRTSKPPSDIDPQQLQPEPDLEAGLEM